MRRCRLHKNIKVRNAFSNLIKLHFSSCSSKLFLPRVDCAGACGGMSPTWPGGRSSRAGTSMRSWSRWAEMRRLASIVLEDPGVNPSNWPRKVGFPDPRSRVFVFRRSASAYFQPNSISSMSRESTLKSSQGSLGVFLSQVDTSLKRHLRWM